ncbi:MAG: carbohydrate porin [Rhodanobacter sp.]
MPIRNRFQPSLAACALAALLALVPWHASAADTDTSALKPAVGLLANLYDNLHGGQRRGTTGAWNLYGSLRYRGAVGDNGQGFSAFAQVLNSGGGFPGDYTGDAQGVSNIAAPHLTRLYEAWMQYNGRRSHWSVLLGRYDLNSEFDRLQTATLFLDSSFGVEPAFSQSGGQGPSIFPRPRFALRVALKPSRNVVWRTAVLQGGVPNDPGLPPGEQHSRVGDALLVSELALLRRAPAADADNDDWNGDMIGRLARQPPYTGKLALGVWHYARPEACLAPDATARACAASGAYLLLDDPALVRIDSAGRRLAGFAQLSVASPGANRFRRYTGVGMSLSPLFDTGADDALGLAVATVHNGRPYLRTQQAQGLPVAASERIYELTYQHTVGAHLTLQPDLQYVMHPDTRPDVANALVFQFEVQLTY